MKKKNPAVATQQEVGAHAIIIFNETAATPLQPLELWETQSCCTFFCRFVCVFVCVFVDLSLQQSFHVEH